jgi:hypothetical protein
MDKTDGTDKASIARQRLRAVAIARRKLDEAFHSSYSSLNVSGIGDAIEEYVTARLLEEKQR